MPTAQTPPSWTLWSNVPAIKVWEAIALSLDIDPKKVRTHDHAWMGGGQQFPHDEGEHFDERLEVLRRNLSKFELHTVRAASPDHCQIYVAEFARWAQSLNWDIPPQLAALAGPPPASSESPAPVRADLGTAERNSLLKLVIGMAVGGYRYEPTATRSQSTSDIATDLESAGVPLDPDTVRKYLKEAAELLPRKPKNQ